MPIPLILPRSHLGTRPHWRALLGCALFVLLSLAARHALAQAADEADTLPAATQSATEADAEGNGEIDAETIPQTTAETAPETPPEAPLFTSRAARDNQLLAASLPHEALWLESDDEPVLALFRPTEIAETKGVVLMLHASVTPPGWPTALENARRALPRHGWATLALTLPPLAPPPPAPRELPAVETIAAEEPDTTEQAGADETQAEVDQTQESVAPPPAAEPSAEPAAENAGSAEAAQPEAEPGLEPEPESEKETAAVLSRADIIHHRVTAAHQWVAQSGYGLIMVVVDNSSVIEVVGVLSSLPPNIVAGVVLVNLQAQEELTTAELDKLFTELALPVLDVFFIPAGRATTALRQRHRATALRNRLPVYQQLHLPPQQTVTLDDDRTFWVERLRGFMERQKKTPPEQSVK